MRKAFFLIIILFLIVPHKSFAQDIITGNQRAETTVINNVNSGSVTTHIETTVNGKTTTIDSNEPGKIEVKNINGDVKINKTTQESPIILSTHTASASPIIYPKITENKNIISIFFEKLSGFLKKFFGNL